jgi:hypothetical protein
MSGISLVRLLRSEPDAAKQTLGLENFEDRVNAAVHVPQLDQFGNFLKTLDCHGFEIFTKVSWIRWTILSNPDRVNVVPNSIVEMFNN